MSRSSRDKWSDHTDGKQRLAVILLVVLAVSLLFRMSPKGATAAESKNTAKQPETNRLDHRVMDGPVAWPLGLKRDPLVTRDRVAVIETEPARDESVPELRLGCILFSGTPRAIINNTVVQEGDLVDGYTVKRILKREVVLERGDRLMSLRL